MLRTQISLTEAQRQALDAEAERTGRSVSALIRRAVDAAYIKSEPTADSLERLRRGFGAWTGRDEDGAAWVERLRSGKRLHSAR